MSLFFGEKESIAIRRKREEGKKEKGQRSVLCFHFFNQSINQTTKQSCIIERKE
jgi:hypothetical protein